MNAIEIACLLINLQLVKLRVSKIRDLMESLKDSQMDRGCG